MDFVVATGIITVFVLLGWSYGRKLSGGGLNTAKRKMLGYGSLFVAGAIYSMFIVSELNGPSFIIIPIITAWGVFVIAVAWRRRRQEKPHED